MNPAEMVPGVRYGTRLKDGVVRFVVKGPKNRKFVTVEAAAS